MKNLNLILESFWKSWNYFWTLFFLKVFWNRHVSKNRLLFSYRYVKQGIS